jgi:flagellar basal body-associated protein FliL
MHRMSRRCLLAGLAGLPAAALADETPAGPPKPSFLPLGEFTVNLHGEDAQYQFIVVSVTLEVVPAAAAMLKDIMPRLKEAVMRRLMAMADQGTLQPGHADPLMLKTMLSDTLRKANPDSIRDVLITRLLYG